MIDDLVVELKKEQQIDNSNEHFAANGQPGSVFLIWRCERAFFSNIDLAYSMNNNWPDKY